jgi:hypothetical protein
MADDRLRRVATGIDNESILWDDEADAAVLVGAGGTAHTGSQGVSYAGANGEAVAQVYGVAIAGPGGTARGGAGCVAFAYDGGNASGGDGSIVWAREGGTASTGIFGAALAVDSQSSALDGSVAVTLRRNLKGATAEVAQFGVALVHNDSDLNAASGPATAIAGAYSLAVAFDDNWVEGALGALLVIGYPSGDGHKFAVGVVDGVNLMPDQPYMVDADGKFVAAQA